MMPHAFSRLVPLLILVSHCNPMAFAQVAFPGQDQSGYARPEHPPDNYEVPFTLTDSNNMSIPVTINGSRTAGFDVPYGSHSRFVD